MSYMEQQMQQQMEAAEYHQSEMVEYHDELADALCELLPMVEEAHPDLYLKYLDLFGYAKNNKERG